jgi:hypothetical protein
LAFTQACIELDCRHWESRWRYVHVASAEWRLRTEPSLTGVTVRLDIVRRLASLGGRRRPWTANPGLARDLNTHAGTLTHISVAKTFA